MFFCLLSLFLPFFFSMFLFLLRRIFSALQPSTGLLWTGPSAPHQERIFLFRLALKTGHDWWGPVAWVCAGCSSSSCGCIGLDLKRLHACVVILALEVVAVVIACSITAYLQITWVRWKLQKKFFEVVPTRYFYYVFLQKQDVLT